jgi:LysM repeat protein/phage head maturation protease
VSVEAGLIDDEGKGWDGQIDHKVVPVSGFKVLDESTGVVEAIVSVTGIEDRVKDTIEPGAYTKTLEDRIPRGCWGHDWLVPISKTVAIKELMPGDPNLPATLRSGKAWPAEAGALMVQTQFNLETQRGREAYSDVKFFGQDQEWSIGYNVPPGGATVDPKTGRRSIKQLVLHEYSPVLHGAMPEAVTQSVKDAQRAYQEMLARVEDPEDKAIPKDGDGKPLSAHQRHEQHLANHPGAAKPKPAAASGTVDSSGHVHVSSGPKGGQFAAGSQGGGSSAPAATKPKGKAKIPIDPNTGKPMDAHQLHVLHMQHLGKKVQGSHVVKKGDTLPSIAAKLLGDPKRWPEIAKVNHFKDPKKIPVGAVINVPIDKPKPAAPKPAAPKAAAAKPVAVKPAKKDDGGAVFVDTPLTETTIEALADAGSLWADIEALVESDFTITIPEDIDLADFVPADTEVEYIDEPADADVDVDVDSALTDDDLALLFASPDVEADLVEAGIKADAPGHGNRGKAEVLRRYWSTGAGAAKIRWGTEGDFDRCSTEISKYMTLEQAHGYCNLLHHRSIGIWPAQHAAMAGKDAKDVVSGSYALGVEPGLAGADGSPKMIDVAVEPGEPCPECDDPTDDQGHCMNPDCSRFGMGVKQVKADCGHDLDRTGHCDTPGCDNASKEAAKAAMLGAVKSLLYDGLITPADLGLKAIDPEDAADAADEQDDDEDPEDAADAADEQDDDDTDVADGKKVSITADLLEAAALFGDESKRDYARDKDGQFARVSGSVQSPAEAIAQRFAETNRKKPVIRPGGQAKKPKKPHIVFPKGHPDEPGAVSFPTGKPGTPGKFKPVANPRRITIKSDLQVVRSIDHEDGGLLVRDGAEYALTLIKGEDHEVWGITDVVTGLSAKVDGASDAIDLPYRSGVRMRAFNAGIDRLQGVETPAVKSSANLALIASWAPASSMAPVERGAEAKTLIGRLSEEKSEPGSMRDHLIRSRIYDLTGSGPLFKATEAIAVQRARTVAIQPAWNNRDTIPPMGEYDQWTTGQLDVAQIALTQALNDDGDIPADYATALQGELSRVVAEQQRRQESTVDGKADGEDFSGLTLEQIGEEAGKVLKAMRGGQNATPALKARLRALSLERKKRTQKSDASTDLIDGDVEVLTSMEILEAERLIADL